MKILFETRHHRGFVELKALCNETGQRLVFGEQLVESTTTARWSATSSQIQLRDHCIRHHRINEINEYRWCEIDYYFCLFWFFKCLCSIKNKHKVLTNKSKRSQFRVLRQRCFQFTPTDVVQRRQLQNLNAWIVRQRRQNRCRINSSCVLFVSLLWLKYINKSCINEVYFSKTISWDTEHCSDCVTNWSFRRHRCDCRPSAVRATVDSVTSRRVRSPAPCRCQLRTNWARFFEDSLSRTTPSSSMIVEKYKLVLVVLNFRKQAKRAERTFKINRRNDLLLFNGVSDRSGSIISNQSN